MNYYLPLYFIDFIFLLYRTIPNVLTSFHRLDYIYYCGKLKLKSNLTFFFWRFVELF